MIHDFVVLFQFIKRSKTEVQASTSRFEAGCYSGAAGVKSSWFLSDSSVLKIILVPCFCSVLVSQGRIACANVLSDLYAMGITECDNMLMLLSVSQKMNDKVAICVSVCLF